MWANVVDVTLYSLATESRIRSPSLVRNSRSMMLQCGGRC